MSIHQYPGGKSTSGTYQRLINQIPPHDSYIETHLGGGAILRHKRPAKENIGIDIDPQLLSRWPDTPEVTLLNNDAVQFLQKHPVNTSTFIYCDPPYLQKTRSSNRSPYRYDYSEAQHMELLETLCSLPGKIMISGYESSLYNDRLKTWRSFTYTTRNRSGQTATEWVWMNYPEPTELHDYRYLGANYRERQRIQRRILRWKEKLSGLPVLEQNALLTALTSP